MSGPAKRVAFSVACLAAIAVVVAAYRPVLAAGFLWDDHQLVEAPPVRGPSGALGVFGRPFWLADGGGDARPRYYRPVVLASFELDRALHGREPGGYHATNLALHVLAAAMLVLAARSLGVGPTAALLSALAWALLPRSTESVAWISGRTDVLAGAFSLAAIALWPWQRGRAEHARAAAASASVFLALCSKETAIAAPAAILAGTFAADSPRRRLLWALAPALAGWAALRTVALPGAASSERVLGAGPRAATVLEAIGRYAWMTVDAWHPQTSIGLVGEVDARFALLGALVCALFLVGVLAILRSRRPPAFDRAALVGGALAVMALLPVIHVLPFSASGVVVADRFLYVPSAGLALALAHAVRRVARWRLLAACALAISLSFAWAVARRAHDYQDDLAFWLRAAEQAHPHNPSPASALASIVRDRFQVELACRLFDRIARTVEAHPSASEPARRRAFENLGACLARSGRLADARAVYDRALEIFASHPRVRMGRAFVELHQGELDGAAADFRRALADDPGLAPARDALAALPHLRDEAARFTTLEARAADPPGYARWLASTGRLKDAADRWLVLALDTEASPTVRAEATSFLERYGSLEAAERAAGSLPKMTPASTELSAALRRRTALEQSVLDVRLRLERLAALPP